MHNAIFSFSLFPCPNLQLRHAFLLLLWLDLKAEVDGDVVLGTLLRVWQYTQCLLLPTLSAVKPYLSTSSLFSTAQRGAVVYVGTMTKIWPRGAVSQAKAQEAETRIDAGYRLGSSRRPQSVISLKPYGSGYLREYRVRLGSKQVSVSLLLIHMHLNLFLCPTGYRVSKSHHHYQVRASSEIPLSTLLNLSITS